MSIAIVARERMVAAMKAKDKYTKDAYAYLLDQIQKEQKSRVSGENPNPVLTEADEIAVCQRIVKAIKSGADKSVAEAKEKGLNLDNMKDYLDDCERKIVLYSEFLPKQMTAVEIQAIIDAIVEPMGNSLNKGLIMKELMPKVKGKADGKLVSELVDKTIAGANKHP